LKLKLSSKIKDQNQQLCITSCKNNVICFPLQCLSLYKNAMWWVAFVLWSVIPNLISLQMYTSPLELLYYYGCVEDAIASCIHHFYQ
jgi:hypothetical protein